MPAGTCSVRSVGEMRPSVPRNEWTLPARTLLKYLRRACEVGKTNRPQHDFRRTGSRNGNTFDK